MLFSWGNHALLLLQVLDFDPKLSLHVLVPLNQHPYGFFHFQQALLVSRGLRSRFECGGGNPWVI